MTKYIFSCPAPDCGHTMHTEAENEDKALNKLLLQGDAHGKDAHPDMPQMTPDQATTMVRVGMKKE